MKNILIVGEFCTPQYDKAIYNAFKYYGFNVDKFVVHGYITGRSISYRFQRFLGFGPSYLKLWISLIIKVIKFKPQIIYFRLPCEYPLWYLKSLKHISNALLISYMNDNPWGLRNNYIKYRYFIKSIPSFDINCIFRRSNESDFINAGAKKIVLILPYYVENMHYTTKKRYSLKSYTYDVLFAGHYEKEFNEIELYFNEIVLNGYTLGLFGNFSNYKYKGLPFEKCIHNYSLRDQNYRKMIESSMISICFFSRLNRDTLTTRIFEIPMCGGLLLCERNDEVTQIFQEDKEALFFSLPNEMILKIKRVKENIILRHDIIKNSRNKILSDKHEVKDRVRFLIENLEV